MEQEYVTVRSIRMAMKSKRVVGMGMGLRRRWPRQDLLYFIGDWLWRSCSELGVDFATCCGHVPWFCFGVSSCYVTMTGGLEERLLALFSPFLCFKFIDQFFSWFVVVLHF